VLIYSKHGTVTYNNYDNTDPAGDVFKDILEATRPPNEPGGIPNMSWTRGDSVYLLDAFSGAERVQDEFVSYANVDDSPEPRYQYMSLFGSAGKNRELLSGFDIYPMAVTPYAFLSLVGTGNFVYAYNVQMMFAGLGFSDVSDASFFDEAESFENEVRNGFFSYEPVDNYNVSVSTRKPIGGENSVGIFRFDAAGGRVLRAAHQRLLPQHRTAVLRRCGGSCQAGQIRGPLGGSAGDTPHQSQRYPPASRKHAAAAF
jgi:hypothetical protein